MTGEPVNSKRLIVSRIASSYARSRLGCMPSPAAAMALISDGGRGMLPMGSVGMFTARSQAQHSSPAQATPMLRAQRRTPADAQAEFARTRPRHHGRDR